jgi:hypothetical protein
MLCTQPGALDQLAFEQLREGRAWEISDLGAPAMSALWGITEQVLLGPMLLLILQSAMVLLGSYAVLCRALVPTAAALVACAILLFPPVLAATMVINADRVMAGLLVAATVALLHDRPRVRVAGLVLCALAVAFRLEAIVAALPLVVLLYDPGRSGLARYGLAATAWLAVSASGVAIDAGLTRHHVASYELVPDEADFRAELPFIAHHIDNYYYLKKVGLGANESRFQDRVRDWMQALARHTTVFQPFVFVVLAALLLPFCLRHRDIGAVLASGVGLGVTTLPGPPSVWPVICACVGLAMLVARRRIR